MSLTPYSGPWTSATAAHLLRRVLYGPTKEQINRAAQEGMNASLDVLLESQATPDPPLNYQDALDTNAPLGTTWVNSPHTGNTSTRNSRWRSLNGWQLANIGSKSYNIESRLLTFWHNHFVVDFATVNDPRFLWTYWETLRRNALGDFKTFVEEITVDPAMLRYLDGRTNTFNRPNENYARELMELFTLGKGEDAGPGDYTTFTEDDVLEIAKILTGWRDVGYNNTNIGTISSQFLSRQHSTEDKQLSHRFGNAIVSNEGENEYKTLVDLIFQKDEVASFIVRKLYRFFVATHIDSSVESEVIEPLADFFRNNNYDIRSTLKVLLASEHFYLQMEVRGGVISNPMEFVFDILNCIGTDVETHDYTIQYTFWYAVYTRLQGLQMAYFAAPDVAGWKAYYLSPQYSELWVNAVTIKHRKLFIEGVLNARGIILGRGATINFNYLQFIDSLDNPIDVDDMINEVTDILMAKGLNEEQKTFLKEILLQGLPDFVWTNEYQAYLDDPTNTQNRSAVINRLQDFFGLIFILPEFQII